MFGSGIGELNVYIRTIGGTSDPDKKIWGLIGDAGNNWYMGQAPVASSRPFKVNVTLLSGEYLFFLNLIYFGLKGVSAQCPRTDLSKRFLPKQMTTTG